MLWIAIARGSAIIFDGLSYIVIARSLGPLDYGLYIGIMAAVTLIDLSADLTVFDIAVREMSRHARQMGLWLGAATSLRVALGMAGLGVYAVYATWGPPSRSHAASVAAILAALALPLGALRTPIAVFRADMRMHYELLLIVVTRIINLLLVLFFVRIGGGLLPLILATVLSRAVLAVLGWVVVVRVFRVIPIFEFSPLKVLFLESIPMAVSGLLVAVQLKLDLVLVAFFRGAASAGLYAVVAQLPEYLLYIPVIMTTPLLPLLSRARMNAEHEEFNRIFRKLFQVIIAVAVPTVVMSFMRPREIVVLAFGQHYAESSRVFPLIMLSVAFMWISHALAVTMVASLLQKDFIWIQCLCVAAFLAVCLLYIPHSGAKAAAWARVIGSFMAPLLSWLVLRRKLRLPLPGAWVLRVLGASAAMAVSVLLMKALSIYTVLLVGTLVYVGFGFGPGMLGPGWRRTS